MAKMINLAGDKNCDQVILQEMKMAGIEPIEIGPTNREVPSRYIGKVNNFIFSRAWYYWVAKGNMPLEHAKYLYENNKEKQIRVAGHCGNVRPEEWAEPARYDEFCQECFADYWHKKTITKEEFETKCEEFRKQGPQFVRSYHIDTDVGLYVFVRRIKDYNIIG